MWLTSMDFSTTGSIFIQEFNIFVVVVVVKPIALCRSGVPLFTP